MKVISRRRFINISSLLGLFGICPAIKSCPDDFEDKGGSLIVGYFINKIKRGNTSTIFRILRNKTAGIRWDKIYLGEAYYPSMIPLDLSDYIEICNRIQNWASANNKPARFNFYIEERYQEANKGLGNIKCAE